MQKTSRNVKSIVRMHKVQHCKIAANVRVEQRLVCVTITFQLEISDKWLCFHFRTFLLLIVASSCGSVDFGASYEKRFKFKAHSMHKFVRKIVLHWFGSITWFSMIAQVVSKSDVGAILSWLSQKLQSSLQIHVHFAVLWSHYAFCSSPSPQHRALARLKCCFPFFTARHFFCYFISFSFFLCLSHYRWILSLTYSQYTFVHDELS